MAAASSTGVGIVAEVEVEEILGILLKGALMALLVLVVAVHLMEMVRVSGDLKSSYEKLGSLRSTAGWTQTQT